VDRVSHPDSVSHLRPEWLTRAHGPRTATWRIRHALQKAPGEHPQGLFQWRAQAADASCVYQCSKLSKKHGGHIPNLNGYCLTRGHADTHLPSPPSREGLSASWAQCGMFTGLGRVILAD